MMMVVVVVVVIDDNGEVSDNKYDSSIEDVVLVMKTMHSCGNDDKLQ